MNIVLFSDPDADRFYLFRNPSGEGDIGFRAPAPHARTILSALLGFYSGDRIEMIDYGIGPVADVNAKDAYKGEADTQASHDWACARD